MMMEALVPRSTEMVLPVRNMNGELYCVPTDRADISVADACQVLGQMLHVPAELLLLALTETPSPFPDEDTAEQGFLDRSSSLEPHVVNHAEYAELADEVRLSFAIVTLDGIRPLKKKWVFGVDLNLVLAENLDWSPASYKKLNDFLSEDESSKQRFMKMLSNFKSRSCYGSFTIEQMGVEVAALHLPPDLEEMVGKLWYDKNLWQSLADGLRLAAPLPTQLRKKAPENASASDTAELWADWLHDEAANASTNTTMYFLRTLSEIWLDPALRGALFLEAFAAFRCVNTTIDRDGVLGGLFSPQDYRHALMQLLESAGGLSADALGRLFSMMHPSADQHPYAHAYRFRCSCCLGWLKIFGGPVHNLFPDGRAFDLLLPAVEAASGNLGALEVSPLVLLLEVFRLRPAPVLEDYDYDTQLADALAATEFEICFKAQRKFLAVMFRRFCISSELSSLRGSRLVAEIRRIILNPTFVDQSEAAQKARAHVSHPGGICLSVSLRDERCWSIGLSGMDVFKSACEKGHPCVLLREGLSDTEIETHFSRELAEASREALLAEEEVL